MTPIDPPPSAFDQLAGAAPGGGPPVHPIVRLGYVVRVPAHLCTLLMLASCFASTGASAWVWGLAVFYGLLWPHLARWLGVRGGASRVAELRNLMVDAVASGVFTALVGFSIWPMTVLCTGFNSACLSVGGPRFAAKAFALYVASAVLTGAANGFVFTPESTLLTSVICAVSFLGYTAIFSLRTYVEAKRLIRMQRELRATNAQMVGQRSDLERALELAEAANRAKSSFLANMSHELRTPLNAIIGYAELLDEDSPAPHQRADLQRIRGSGRHLLGLINDVLDLSKIEAGRSELQIERVALRAFVDEVVSTMQPMLTRSGNRFVLEVADTVGFMDGDASRIRQVLLNLLSNAVKFTHDGEVRLVVRRLVSEDGDAGDAGEGGERVVFEIRDNGIGVSAEQLARLFQPFVQADSATTRRYGGTGLGLAISRRLCEMMGGDIAVRSTLGRGTCFTVSLPVAAPAPAPPPATPTEPPLQASAVQV
ncbi:ATP-binding protein [Pseudorhodoferax sp.]|uniref:ATP-binding protein n=1 Tax=Pseudorhodoferax sp. TaxID=1993553 RepID=UPI002DD68B1E|nr:ATP-binding protein [Pseudorhodoferax sp.]